MSRVLRPVRKRKKSRKLGPVDVIRREDYGDLELDAKVELIRSLVPLGLMHVEEMLDDEVTALAGARYARKDASIGGRRHGSNPGTVGLAGQRVPIRVPRIRRVAGGEIPLRSYAALHGEGAVNDRLLTRVLYGISCRNYAAAAEAIPGAIGLSGSTVSRTFIQASAAKLHEFHERDLSNENVVAIVLDGKTFAEATMVIALGITMTGEKRFLGFVETDTENAQVLTPFLRSLLERGLDISQGVLVILDGGKGLRAAVRKAFRRRAVVQRCQWHKRENVVSYLAKTEQPLWRQRLQRAYHRPEYDEAVAALRQLHGELEDRNQSAARSLTEGFDETLTLHRLGLYGVLGRSLKTTNCLESINALVEERCAKVDLYSELWEAGMVKARLSSTTTAGSFVIRYRMGNHEELNGVARMENGTLRLSLRDDSEKIDVELAKLRPSISLADNAEPETIRSDPTSDSVVRGSGTGFVVHPSGLVLTANNVVEDATTIEVACSGQPSHRAVVRSSSASTDLALLELADEFEAETFLGLAQQRAPSLGDEVFTVGYPLVGLLGDDPKYTDGTISALSGPGGDASFLQISVPVQPGNSGGPLVNEQGEVVGVVIATASAPVFFQVSGTIPQNINWAVRGLYAAALFEPPAEAPAMAETRGGMIERVQAATCLVLTEQ